MPTQRPGDEEFLANAPLERVIVSVHLHGSASGTRGSGNRPRVATNNNIDVIDGSGMTLSLIAKPSDGIGAMSLAILGANRMNIIDRLLAQRPRPGQPSANCSHWARRRRWDAELRRATVRR